MRDLFGLQDEKVDLTNDHLIRQRVLRRDRVFRVVARLEHLLVWLLKHLEEELDQIWSIEVMKVLLTEV